MSEFKFLHLTTLESEGRVLYCQTHNGIFHTDDVFFSALLRLYSRDYGIKCIIKRVANAEPIRGITFDIGCKYDPEIGCFDHHQEDSLMHKVKTIKNGEVLFEDEKRSSFGQLWEYIGDYYLKGRSNWVFDTQFVKPICHHDNYGGCDALSNIIKDFNPTFNEEDTQDYQDNRFFIAVNFAEHILIRRFQTLAGNQSGVANSIESAMDETVKQSGILVLDKYPKGINSALNVKCPWVYFFIVPDQRESFEETYILHPVFSNKNGDAKIKLIDDERAFFFNEKFAKFKTLQDATQYAQMLIDGARICQ